MRTTQMSLFQSPSRAPILLRRRERDFAHRLKAAHVGQANRRLTSASRQLSASKIIALNLINRSPLFRRANNKPRMPALGSQHAHPDDISPGMRIDTAIGAASRNKMALNRLPYNRRGYHGNSRSIHGGHAHIMCFAHKFR